MLILHNNRVATIDPETRDKISVINFVDKISQDVVVLNPAEMGDNRKIWRITSLVWSPDGTKIAFKVEKSSGSNCNVEWPMGASCVSKEWGKIIILDLQSGDKTILDLFNRGNEYGESQIVTDWRDDTIYLFPSNTDNFYDRYVRATTMHYPKCVHHDRSPYYGDSKHPYYPPILKLNLNTKKVSEYDFVNDVDLSILLATDNPPEQLEFSCELDDNKAFALTITRSPSGVAMSLLRRYYILDKSTGELKFFYETDSKSNYPRYSFADITPDGMTLLMKVRNVINGFYVDTYALLDTTSKEMKKLELSPKSFLLSF